MKGNSVILRNRSRGLALVAFLPLFSGAILHAEEDGPAASVREIPAAVTEEDFNALRTSSPFLRSLDLSQSLMLTGVARIEGQLFATLVDRETKKTHLVSQSANPEGWRMVAVAGNEADLTTVSAEIAMASGEVFAVRYDEKQLHPPEQKPGGPGGSGEIRRDANGRPVYTNFREGISGDGFRGPPPPEMVAKLEKLDDQTRERLIQGIREYRDKNPNVSSEDRQRLFTRMVDDALNRRR
ncbi:MAG: hypothetical protein KDN18_09260 [Verrucomicrobiae bacterium]|nr:hypothetical protein [Verrucomicrobiae bacterium]